MTSAIKTSSGAKYAKIMSVGGYRPERIVTNAEICEHIDSSDEWIRERSGIIERRYAALDETVVDMGAAAAAQALERSGIAPEQIGMVLTANVTHPYQTPSAAAEIAYRIGAVTAGALDIAAACAGFCYGVGLGNDLVCGGTANYVIVIGVEKLSDWTDPKDRGSAFILLTVLARLLLAPRTHPRSARQSGAPTGRKRTPSL